MATTTPKPLYHGQPGNTAAAAYTVPAATTTVVRHFRCVNKDTAAHTLELWHYASGGSATNATAITETITIPSGGSWEDDVYLPMNAGDVLAAKADTASKITLYVGGAEIA